MLVQRLALFFVIALGQSGLSNGQCNPLAEYRTADGSCNNLLPGRELWGSAGQCLHRFLPPLYEDGVDRLVGEGRVPPLPTPRTVSTTISGVPVTKSNTGLSEMVMNWGQFLDHDLTVSPTAAVGQCCNNEIYDPGEEFDGNCRPIVVIGDPFYDSKNVQCLPFSRSTPCRACQGSCGRETQQINLLTAWVDGSMIYGSSQEEQDRLRSFVDGLLKTNEFGSEFPSNGGNSCPITCPFLPEENGMFLAGDDRVEEQPGLTSVHTLFMRVHNLIARILKFENGFQNDEFIFQEVRRIVVAIVQRISYDEFLKEVLGNSWDNPFHYAPFINPNIANVFAAAAYRFGHSLVQRIIHLREGVVDLVESFENHTLTEQPGMFPSDFLEALPRGSAPPMDQRLSDALTNFLFAEFPFDHGQDLFSRNIQRGRDHGLPPYVRWRDFCGLPRVRNFFDLARVMPPRVARALNRIYRSVNEIDIFPALISEDVDPSRPGGGILGPTGSCILEVQFRRLKDADRFWYENQNQPRSFTQEQIAIIKRTTLSSLICVASSTSDIQSNAFRLPSFHDNPIVDCDRIIEGTMFDPIQEFFSTI